MTLSGPEWLALALGALLIGLAKTGVPGLGALFIALFANVLPAREASGLVLPLLIVADMVAVAAYRRHAQWAPLWRLFPWTALGIVIGYLSMDRFTDRQAEVVVGVIILLVATLQWGRGRGWFGRIDQAQPKIPAWVAPGIGILAGFTTLIANAAGPLMVLYLLAMGLPKLQFMGTGAFYFLIMNVFKVPFMADLGLVSLESLKVNLGLLPALFAGTFCGRWLLPRLPQGLFENLVLALTLVGGMNLLVRF